MTMAVWDKGTNDRAEGRKEPTVSPCHCHNSYCQLPVVDKANNGTNASYGPIILNRVHNFTEQEMMDYYLNIKAVFK